MSASSELTGSDLLHRPAPASYRAEQSIQLAAPLPRTILAKSRSVIVFRLCQEWFALPAGLCRQALAPLPAHTLPYRSNATLLGIVNVRGQMLLKVSLSTLLNLPPVCSLPGPKQSTATQRSRLYARMLVIEKVGRDGSAETWVFEVDELEGIQLVEERCLESAAAGITASASSCMQFVFVWQNHRVNLLDDSGLFDALRLRAL
ncbi:MAG: chemotaxis protein CheW [Cyanobacteria bacterium J06598_1]